MLPRYTPPSGQRIFRGQGEQASAEDALQALGTAILVDSGTAALIVALQDCLARNSERRQDKPEVIVPAYCCPQILSAINFVGATPVLTDLEPNTTWLDLDTLQSAISSRTVAIIAINFLGIPERLQSIARLIGHEPIRLVYDCCQAFPELRESDPEAIADYVLWSFGRGKPVSLLHGGAIHSRRPIAPEVQRSILPPEQARLGSLSYQAHLTIYDIARQPIVYPVLDALGLAGGTRYSPASAPRQMQAAVVKLLGVNWREYRNLDPTVGMRIREIVATSDPSIIDLTDTRTAGSPQRLLRYPLLCERKQDRDNLLTELRANGIGASALYGATLPDIRDVDLRVQADNFPVAKSFADRLLTLPTHAGIRETHLEKLAIVLGKQRIPGT